MSTLVIFKVCDRSVVDEQISTRALQVLIFLVTMETQPINGGIT